jgi:hypothetical protein
MKAFVTSIGEKTTDVCIWALKRNGFDVTPRTDSQSLAEKLKWIYSQADDDFVRIDADVIVNRNCKPENILRFTEPLKTAWWIQFQMFDWYQQDVSYGGIQFIRKEALPVLRENVDKFMQHERPETELTRSYGMYNPRRFESYDMVMGLHNYKNDMERVKTVKSRRNQLDNYDFDLAQRLEEL